MTFIAGIIIGLVVALGIALVIGAELWGRCRRLRAENSELVRKVGAQQWADKSILDQLDAIAQPQGRGISSNRADF